MDLDYLCMSCFCGVNSQQYYWFLATTGNRHHGLLLLLPWLSTLEVYPDIPAVCLRQAPLAASDGPTVSVAGPMKKRIISTATSSQVLSMLHLSRSQDAPTWHPRELYGTASLLCRIPTSSLWFHACSGRQTYTTNQLSSIATSRTVPCHSPHCAPAERASLLPAPWRDVTAEPAGCTCILPTPWMQQ